MSRVDEIVKKWEDYLEKMHEEYTPRPIHELCREGTGIKDIPIQNPFFKGKSSRPTNQKGDDDER